MRILCQKPIKPLLKDFNSLFSKETDKISYEYVRKMNVNLFAKDYLYSLRTFPTIHLVPTTSAIYFL